MKQNLYKALENAPIDPEVGIAVTQLAGQPDLALYVARIEAGKVIAPHFHTQGSESYQVVSGSGLMRLGWPVSETEEKPKVNWQKEFSIEAGDCFVVLEGQVHQLVNTSDEALIAIFGCSENHMGPDRIICQSE